MPLLPPTTGGLRQLPITLGHAAAIPGAGVAFWPRADGPGRAATHAPPATLARVLASPLLTLLRHTRGARLLSLSLLAWGGLQVGFLLPLPDVADRALLRVAGLLQGLQSLALVMLVLDRARQRAEFLRSFNQTLLDAMDLGLVLVGPDLRSARCGLASNSYAPTIHGRRATWQPGSTRSGRASPSGSSRSLRRSPSGGDASMRSAPCP